MTFRLADSLPADRLARWEFEREEWLKLAGLSYGDYDFNYDIHTAEEAAKLEEIATNHGLRLRRASTLLWSKETVEENDAAFNAANGTNLHTDTSDARFLTNRELCDRVAEVACHGTFFKEIPHGFDKVYYFNEGTFSFFNILPDLTTTPSASFADGFMVALPALVCLILFAVLTLIPQLYMSRNQTGQQAQSMRMMAVVMTVMMLWMGWSLPVGVLLYYDVSSAWQVIQQIFVTQKVIEKAKAEEEERLKNAPLQVEVTRREKKPRPHKKK